MNLCLPDEAGEPVGAGVAPPVQAQVERRHRPVTAARAQQLVQGLQPLRALSLLRERRRLRELPLARGIDLSGPDRRPNIEGAGSSRLELRAWHPLRLAQKSHSRPHRQSRNRERRT